jgi:hypothetical protein
MNRFLLVLIVLAVAVIAVMQRAERGGREEASGEPAPSPPASTAVSADMRSFHDPAGGYRIRYPSDWKLEDHSRADHLIRADISKGTETGAQIRIEKGISLDFPTYVNRYIERFKRDMTQHWGGQISVVDRRFGDIGAHPGCQVSLISKRRDSREWLFKEYLWPHGDWVYIVQAGTELGSRDENEPSLDAIAESLELTNEPGKK